MDQKKKNRTNYKITGLNYDLNNSGHNELSRGITLKLHIRMCGMILIMSKVKY